LRRALLDDALKFYQGLSGQESTDPATRREIAHAYQKIGDIFRALGKDGDADRAYAGAAAIQHSVSE
jgi:hypothetical protein